MEKPLNVRGYWTAAMRYWAGGRDNLAQVTVVQDPDRPTVVLVSDDPEGWAQGWGYWDQIQGNVGHIFEHTGVTLDPDCMLWFYAPNGPRVPGANPAVFVFQEGPHGSNQFNHYPTRNLEWLTWMAWEPDPRGYMAPVE